MSLRSLPQSLSWLRGGARGTIDSAHDAFELLESLRGAAVTVPADWISRAQHELRRQGWHGWLLYDFRGLNPVLRRFVPLTGHGTRRVFLYVPTEGVPVFLTHEIEAGSVPQFAVDVAVRTYAGRVSLERELAALLPQGRVALEYSPRGDVPYVSFVDGGTVDLLRGLGVEPVSSAPLLQLFDAWTERQLEQHLEACGHVAAARAEAFAWLADRVAAGAAVHESDVQDVISRYFDARGLIYDHPAIVGFGPNSGAGHYAPRRGADRELQAGDTILIDLWCKLPDDDAPYADITWMGSAGTPTEELQHAFAAVVAARDSAVEAIRAAYAAGRYPEGREADRAARDLLTDRGYGAAFRHRTGHSLGTDATHGRAAHLDDFETRDTRPLQPGLGVTVEPGVYFDHFGVRSEIDVYLEETGPRVTTEVQHELIVIPVAS